MGCSCLRARDKAPGASSEEKRETPEASNPRALLAKSKTMIQKRHRKKNSEAARSADSSSKLDLDFSIRSADQVNILQKPLSSYYKLTADFDTDPSLRVTKAQNLVTNQSCVILFKPVGLADDTSTTEKHRYVWKLWSSLDHPQILKTYECMKDTKGEYWVFEDYDGGNAQEWLTNAHGEIPESLVMKVMFTVFTTLKYIHSKGIVLRTMNLESLVFPQAVSETSTEAKLGYFFHACEIGVYTELPASVRKSPFLSLEARFGYSGIECDLWSCGVLLYYLLSGSSPFPSTTKTEILEAAMQHKVRLNSQCWKEVSEEAKDLTMKLLQRNKEDRPSIAECLECPCISKQVHRRNLSRNGIRRTLTSISSKPSSVPVRQALMDLILTRVVKKESLTLLSDTFKALDTDLDGRISKEELLIGMRNIHTEEEAVRLTEEIMKSGDRDGSGSIDYSEFLMASNSEEKLLSRDNLKKAFLSFDRDGNEKISLEELRKALILKQTSHGDKVWRTIIRGFDKSGDGEIDFLEFYAMVESALKKSARS